MERAIDDVDYEYGMNGEALRTGTTEAGFANVNWQADFNHFDDYEKKEEDDADEVDSIDESVHTVPSRVSVDLNGKSAFDTATEVKLTSKFKQGIRLIETSSFFSAWIHAVECCAQYCPGT